MADTLQALLDHPPFPFSVEPHDHGVGIAFQGHLLLLDARRYRYRSSTGDSAECPLHLVDVVLLQPDYLLVSLPETTDGYSEHLRLGHDLNDRQREWLRDVLEAAAATAVERKGGPADVPADLRRRLE